MKGNEKRVEQRNMGCNSFNQNFWAEVQKFLVTNGLVVHVWRVLLRFTCKKSKIMADAGLLLLVLQLDDDFISDFFNFITDIV